MLRKERGKTLRKEGGSKDGEGIPLPDILLWKPRMQ